MKLVRILFGGLMFSAPAAAAPLVPNIIGHDFAFGAHNSDGTPEYDPAGAGDDLLEFTPFSGDREVMTYRPEWPTGPAYPVFGADDPSAYGGDFVLSVRFTGQDAPQGALDVSLVGTGGNDAGPDLQLLGTITLDGGREELSGVLWELELDEVAMYGYSGEDALVLEGIGTVVGGAVADYFGLVGLPGGVRGHLDFTGQPTDWFPSMYDPSQDLGVAEFRAAYSGETGVLPEPAAVVLVLSGIPLLARRRF